MKEVVRLLKEKKQTIATMESCTGGFIASEITNISGASEVLKFSAVTYSNEYKIKMGVAKKVIDKYSVYSIETATCMAKSISDFSLSDYGVGITGKLNNPDFANDYGDNDTIFIAIYDKDNNNYYRYDIKAKKGVSRKKNKEYIAAFIIEKLYNIINESEEY